ncbi:MAG: acyl-CoA dehydrogenase family protein, partial [Solirubrobacteraceae bacterium]
SHVAYAAAMEEITAGCPATSLVYMTQMHAAYPIWHAGSEELATRLIPGLIDGSRYGSLAITEPAAGSDAAALRTRATPVRGEGSLTGSVTGYRLTGSKTFITTGDRADVIVCFATVDPTLKRRGITALVVEGDSEGLTRGRPFEKMGMHGSSTAELFFEDVRVPVQNLIGELGQGFRHMTSNLAQERLSIATAAVGAARGALDLTLAYVKERTAFGQPIGAFQSSRFALAEMATEVELATAFCDRAVLALNDSELTAADAAMAKWWSTELQGRVIDRCVQLHGGYGYMLEYPIARAWVDARVTRIYGGTTEIMKEIIGRSLGV